MWQLEQNIMYYLLNQTFLILNSNPSKCFFFEFVNFFNMICPMIILLLLMLSWEQEVVHLLDFCTEIKCCFTRVFALHYTPLPFISCCCTFYAEFIHLCFFYVDYVNFSTWVQHFSSGSYFSDANSQYSIFLNFYFNLREFSRDTSACYGVFLRQTL